MVCLGKWEDLPDIPFGQTVSVWDLSGLEYVFQVLDQLLILTRFAEKEEAAV